MLKQAIDHGLRFFAGMTSVFMIFIMLGEALTGGVRLEARPVAEVVSPFHAAMLLLWLVAVLAVSIRGAKQ